MADAVNKVTDTVGKTAQGATDAAGQGVKDVSKGASDATKGTRGDHCHQVQSRTNAHRCYRSGYGRFLGRRLGRTRSPWTWKDGPISDNGGAYIAMKRNEFTTRSSVLDTMIQKH